ncbi:unannotated protein [freshwater metagenome]|uniref:Unannotated protein n=1 Tax=freshwater metagenome TaxID=449393 RepID=A0A6J7GKM5_9ZZZZ|nr:biotin--[acetyl-CoA-carboxylase] ligase [Actinomycetota bacterium]
MSDKDARTVLNVTSLQAALDAAGWAGPMPTVLDTTESTNNDVARLAAAGAVEGACIVAEHQSQGRGRQARDWVSPPHAGLWMSVLIRPKDMPRDSWTWLPLLAGLAASDAVNSIAQVPTQVKWPNDLVVIADHGKHQGKPFKLAGILSEAIDDSTVVLGIGINVSLTKEELPIPTGTSITLERGVVNREALMAQVLVNLVARLEQWRARDQDLVHDYRAVCATIGRTIEATLPGDKVIRGVAVQVDNDGHLVIEVGSDTVIVTAGDVIHATI